MGFSYCQKKFETLVWLRLAKMEARTYCIHLDDIDKMITIRVINACAEESRPKLGRPRKYPATEVRHRGPSKYNCFISSALKKIALEHPSLPSTERMQLAQDMYKNRDAC